MRWSLYVSYIAKTSSGISPRIRHGGAACPGRAGRANALIVFIVTTRLLLAPAGHGKTHYLIDRIHAIRAAEPLAPVTVILPNQIRVAEFRQRLAQVGGALGVTLTTFHTLYAELLTRTGQPKARLTDPIQIRLLRSIVDRLCEEHRLHHYAPLRGKPGFVAALRDTIQELKRARVEPDTFFTAIMGLGPRLEELAAIYIEYQDWLRKEDWADPEGQGWLAALALVAQSELGHELRLLAVNSFDEFNPTQLGVLALLAERAQETIITLTGDLTRDRLAQRRFIRARQAIIEQLHITPEALNAEHSVRSAELAAIENGLFESHQPTIHDLQSIEFIEAQNRAEEARAALRWIKIRCVRDGLALSEVAVLARDLEPYRAFLEEISAEFGLPLRLIGGAPLIDNPAIAALLSLLSLSMLDWPRRRILEAWRSPYFDWSPYGITLDDAAVLDTVSRIGRVVAGLDQWREAFELLRKRRGRDPEASRAGALGRRDR